MLVARYQLPVNYACFTIAVWCLVPPPDFRLSTLECSLIPFFLNLHQSNFISYINGKAIPIWPSLLFKNLHTMHNLKNKVEHLNSLILEGKPLDAFELYYDDEVVMQENASAPTIGKNANRQREIEFFGSITDFRGASIENVAIGNDVAMVVWNYDYTHKDWGERKYQQVSVQNWKDGKIVKEQFFYGN